MHDPILKTFPTFRWSRPFRVARLTLQTQKTLVGRCRDRPWRSQRLLLEDRFRFYFSCAFWEGARLKKHVGKNIEKSKKEKKGLQGVHDPRDGSKKCFFPKKKNAGTRNRAAIEAPQKKTEPCDPRRSHCRPSGISLAFNHLRFTLQDRVLRYSFYSKIEFELWLFVNKWHRILAQVSLC